MNHISIRNSLINLIDSIPFVRKPKVQTTLPETTLNQRVLPLIIVETPRMESLNAFDSTHSRETYSCDIHFIDAHKASPDGKQDTINYLQWLRHRTIQEILRTKHIDLPQLHIHTSFIRYEFATDIEELEGANLVKVRCTLTVPVIVQNDLTWIFANASGISYPVSGTLDYSGDNQ